MAKQPAPHKPVIGISTNFSEIREKPFEDYHKIFINSGYIDVIIQSGAVPLLLPLNADAATTEHLLSLVDGVLLSGGQDVHPSYYKEEQHPLLGVTARQRDEHELLIVRTAYKEKKPMLGICRGLQLINIYFGGTLYQDLSLHSDTSKAGHSLDYLPDPTLHSVEIVPETLLHRILGTPSIMTNSYHHQAVKDLAPGFKVAAIAEDGVVEAIEGNSLDSWIIAVQWHPEVMVAKCPEMKRLFETFIQQAKG
jgi:putative glutamine amidotransferase